MFILWGEVQTSSSYPSKFSSMAHVKGIYTEWCRQNLLRACSTLNVTKVCPWQGQPCWGSACAQAGGHFTGCQFLRWHFLPSPYTPVKAGALHPWRELQNRRRDVGMLGMRSPVCWRPSSSLFEHGKHILYVTLIINKTLTSYTQLFFSYDNAWYNVFHEHFYLKLPLSCETKQFKMDCLNFLKNKHCKFFFKDTFTKCNQRWISDPNGSQTQGMWQNYKCENDVEWDIKLESEVEDKLGCHAGGSAAFLLQWVSLFCSQFLLECLFLNANLFQYDWCIREKAIWA